MAITLAIAVVVFGVLAVIYFYGSMNNQIAGVSFQPTAAPSQDASRLEKSYLGTQNRLLHSLNIKQFPNTIAVVNIDEEIARVSKLDGESQQGEYLRIGKNTEASINAMKKYHFSEFSEAISLLRQSLLDKAAELRRTYAQQNANQPLLVPTPTPSATTNTVSPSILFRLFSDDIDNDKYRGNKINQVKEFLNSVRSRSQKPESLDEINQASIYLAQAESLLDYVKKSEEILNNPIQQQGNQQAQEQEQMISQAEHVAEQLQQMRAQLAQSLYETWVVDTDIQRLISDSTEGVNRAASAQTIASGIRMAALGRMALSLFSALALGFIIMVIADFLRAFLNMSNNTDTLASAQLTTEKQINNLPAS